MAQTNFTTIVSYNSATASQVPLAADLTQGELAVNVTDKKVYTKNSGGSVVQVGSGPDATETLTNKTLTSPVISGGTINNAAIGSTTPAAGSFTTLSASTSSNVGTGSGTSGRYSIDGQSFLSKIGTANYLWVGQDHGFVVTYDGSAVIADFSSTGLAVTGALSATGGNATLSDGYGYRWGDGTTGIYGNGTTDTITLYTAGTSQATLDTSGNLGLGVTPSAWYSASKAIQLKNYGAVFETGGGATNIAFNCYENANGTFKYLQSEYACRYSQVSGFHAWYTAPSGTAGDPITFTQAMTLDASGNLLVGTTSSGASNTNSFVIAPSSGAFAGQHASGTASGTIYANFNYNAATIGSITQSGTTAVLYNTTSDQRLKKNIADAESASSLIDSIQVRQFDWKSDNSHQRYGMVAQELALVAPEAVHQPADPDDMMAVDYSKLVPMLVKEIQSLRGRLAALEAK